MKFLCDRCKTRYSIGDDRVRGKILKIRCKNCANVITVREGMPDADTAEAGAGTSGVRRKQNTTQAPAAQQQVDVSNGGRGNALGAAFASAMTKPPPALEEEWYVSIDGDQAGPFSLAEAQRWVAGKVFDAELHCWSEGFDDWLPVDKVSHFRGLRKKPQPAPSPPPLPRVGSGPSRAMMSAPVEEEPKALFAATMASLEKNAPPAGAVRGLGLPPLTSPLSGPMAPARPSATPPTGQPAIGGRVNGSPAPLPAAARAPAPLSQPTKSPAFKPSATPTPKPGAGAVRPTTTPGVVGPKTAQGLGFDASELSDSTQIESPPFDDDVRTTAEPIAARRQSEPRGPVGPNDAFINAMAAQREADAASTVPHVPAAAIAALDDVSTGEPDDMEIGEVSRVVKLADLARTPRSQPQRRSGAIPNPSTSGRNPAMIGRASGSAPSLGGSSPKLVGGTVPVALIDAVEVLPGAGVNGQLDQGLVPEFIPPMARSHRLGMIALLFGATLLLGVAIVVVVVVTKQNEDETGLGGQYETDTTRPDDPTIRRRDPTNPGSAAVEPPQNPFVPKKRIPQGSAKQDLPPAGGNALKADEIETMANKSNGLTSRCFMRATKGADGILLGDVKKVTVSLSINADGVVNDVRLSDNHANDTLGKCLIGFIRGWKFRTSPGGNFQFILARPEI